MNIHKERYVQPSGRAVYTQTGWEQLPSYTSVRDDARRSAGCFMIWAIFIGLMAFYYFYWM